MKLQFWYSSIQKTFDGKSQGIVKLSIILDGKESYFSTGIKVLKIDWSSRGTSVLTTDPEAQQKNRELGLILSNASEVVKRLRQKEVEYNSASVIAILIHLKDTPGRHSKSALLEEVRDKDLESAFQKKQNEQRLTFLQALDNLVTYKKRVTEGTKGQYKARRVKVVEYFTHLQIKDMPAEEVSSEFFTIMIDWMEEEMKSTTIKKYVMHYVSALKQAKKRGLIKNNPLADFEYAAENAYDYTYLDETELYKLQFIQNLSPTMEKVRDVFWFMCHTSLHYTDYQSLTKEDIDTREVISTKTGKLQKVEWLEKRRDKTDIEYCQKMHPFASQVIMKYGTVEAMPRFKYHTFYLSVKKLAKLAGIEKNVTPKTGRKTFAYYCLNIWRYSLETTAKMMGLNKTDTILYYAKVGRERIDREVSFE